MQASQAMNLPLLDVRRGVFGSESAKSSVKFECTASAVSEKASVNTLSNEISTIQSQSMSLVRYNRNLKLLRK